MANEQTTTAIQENIFEKVLRHWRGQGTLAWAYWGFHFGGGMILLFMLAIAFLFLLPFAYSPDRPIQHSRVFSSYLLAASCIYLAYVCASVVMIWRCGDNVTWPGWKYIARAVVLFWVVRLVLYVFFMLL